MSSALVHATAEELVGNDAFVAALADEASELLFTGHFKERLKVSLAQLLNQRLTLHAQAVAHLKNVREELAQPWRLEAGGKDHAPTPTPHLVAMAGEAHHEMVKAEEALLKTIRLSLEEQKQLGLHKAELQGRAAFTGEGDAMPVPPELDAGERETIRSLVHLLQQEVTARASRKQMVLEAQVQADCAPPTRLAGSTALPDLPVPPGESPKPPQGSPAPPSDFPLA